MVSPGLIAWGMKMKLTKEQYDALPDMMKGLYKLDGEHYVPTFKTQEEHEAEVAGLKSTNEKLIGEKRETSKKAAEAAEAARIAQEEADKKNGNVQALEASWTKKFQEQEEAHKNALAGLNKQLHGLTVGAAGKDLCAKLFGKNAHLGSHAINSRLTMETAEDGTSRVRVLDADGKPSAATLEDLEKEFRDNKEFAAIIATEPGGLPHGQPQKFTPGAQGGGNPLIDNSLMEAALKI